jgi:large subunit ribosomal protein L24e
MSGKKQKVQKEAAKEYEQSIHLLKAPSAVLAPEKIKVAVSQQAEENRVMEE